LSQVSPRGPFTLTVVAVLNVLLTKTLLLEHEVALTPVIALFVILPENLIVAAPIFAQWHENDRRLQTESVSQTER
jgi:hypothetical protein